MMKNDTVHLENIRKLIKSARYKLHITTITAYKRKWLRGLTGTFQHVQEGNRICSTGEQCLSLLVHVVFVLELFISAV